MSDPTYISQARLNESCARLGIDISDVRGASIGDGLVRLDRVYRDANGNMVPSSTGFGRDGAPLTVSSLIEIRTAEWYDGCLCKVVAANADGEDGDVEVNPACPVHGDENTNRIFAEKYEYQYARLARLVGLDPDEPFPAVDVFDEVARRLGEARP